MNAGEGFLALLNSEPTLLPEGPAEIDTMALHRRACHETHNCLRCGKISDATFIARTDIGNRWLDLCSDCMVWLIKQMDEAVKRGTPKGWDL